MRGERMRKWEGETGGERRGEEIKGKKWRGVETEIWRGGRETGMKKRQTLKDRETSR